MADLLHLNWRETGKYCQTDQQVAASSHTWTLSWGCTSICPLNAQLHFVSLPCATCFMFLLSPHPCPLMPCSPEFRRYLKYHVAECPSYGDTMSTALLHMPSTSPFLWYYLTFQRLPFKLAISQRASRGQLSPSWLWMPRQAVAQRGIPLGCSHRLWLVLCQARQKIPRADQTEVRINEAGL